MTVTKVLIDGGVELNIIFSETLRKMGLDFAELITPIGVPFYGIVPSKAAMPLEQITLSVTFGTQTNYRTEFIQFEVVNFETSYHAILRRPTLAKFMAISHYPYLLLKMSGPHGILFLRGDLKHAFDCDIQAIQIAAKAQAADGREGITTVAAQMNLKELETPAKKPYILAPQKEVDVKKLTWVLVTSRTRRPSVLTSRLNRNSGSPTFFGTIKISLLRSRPTCQVSQESWLSIESMLMKAPN
jgi:hypothetical protein